MRNSLKLSYSVQMVQRQDKDTYLAALCLPEAGREAVCALYALALEMAHIAAQVKEELIAHIRFTWWREALEEIYVGEKPRRQPVLEVLAGVIKHLPQQELIAWLESYALAFPRLPEDGTEREKLVKTLLGNLGCDTLRWEKAKALIAAHRAKYARRNDGWLAMKLLWM